MAEPRRVAAVLFPHFTEGLLAMVVVEAMHAGEDRKIR